MTVEADVQARWDEFWAPIVAPGGELDLDQVKRELFDFSVVMHEVPHVYMHVTGGRISKANSRASAVIGAADDFLADMNEGASPALSVISDWLANDADNATRLAEYLTEGTILNSDYRHLEELGQHIKAALIVTEEAA